MKIGVMQPYFLPYIGYFALINGVDKFVFLDDVQYIRRQGKGKSWVNRNRIKVANDFHYITLPIKRTSLSAKINEVYIVDDEKYLNTLKKTIQCAYLKAPLLNDVKDLIFNLIYPSANISKLNIDLTNKICNYLNIKTEIYVSSELEKDNSFTGEDRVINICKLLNGDQYINAIGGTKLYSKERFLKHGLKLSFMKMNAVTYFQGKGSFISNLSIIDVLMWNPTKDVKSILQNYTLCDGE